MDYLVTGLTPEERQSIASALGVGNLGKWQAFISRDHGDGKTVTISTTGGGNELQQFVDKLIELKHAKVMAPAGKMPQVGIADPNMVADYETALNEVEKR